MKYQMKVVIFDIIAECTELKQELSDAGIQIAAPNLELHTEQTLQALVSGTEFSLVDCLMITNKEQHARIAKELGIVVVGCMEGQFEVPKKVTLLESPDQVSVVYLNQEFCHHRGLPATIIETKRCILQEMTEDDAEELYCMLSEKEVVRFLPPMTGNKEEELDKIKSYLTQVYSFFGYGYWGVFLKHTGKLIGRAGFKEGSYPLEAGYVIQHSDWGKGLATEVLEALLLYAREELACSKVLVRIHRDNKASLKVAEKCGFRKEQSDFMTLEMGTVQGQESYSEDEFIMVRTWDM